MVVSTRALVGLTNMKIKKMFSKKLEEIIENEKHVQKRKTHELANLSKILYWI